MVEKEKLIEQLEKQRKHVFTKLVDYFTEKGEVEDIEAACYLSESISQFIEMMQREEEETIEIIDKYAEIIHYSYDVNGRIKTRHFEADTDPFWDLLKIKKTAKKLVYEHLASKGVVITKLVGD